MLILDTTGKPFQIACERCEIRAFWKMGEEKPKGWQFDGFRFGLSETLCGKCIRSLPK